MIQAHIAFVGGGPAGYAGALHAARSGLDTVLIEADQLGGTCLNTGCIPSKAWLATASVARTIKSAKRFGFALTVEEFDYERARKRVQQVVSILRKGLGQTLLPDAGVRILSGRASLTATGIDVRMEDGSLQKIKAEHIVLATGSEEFLPPGFALHPPRVVTSREALFLENLPQKALIVGGGAIGCEFASFWTDLGVDVTLVEMADRILPGAPVMASENLHKGLARRKIRIYTAARAFISEQDIHTIACRIAGADKDTLWTGDTVLISVGRRPRTDDIGLESRSIARDPQGRVLVDPVTRQTSAPGVYACGDITEGPMLAHKASAEAVFIVEQILDNAPEALDWNRIPMCVYAEPEVAWVGDLSGASQVVPVAASGRARAEASIEGLFALAASDQKTVDGMLAIGAHASESILIGSLAMASTEGLALWRKVIAAHPTRSELLMDAVALALGSHGHNL